MDQVNAVEAKLNLVNVDLNARASINYVKGRFAIEEGAAVIRQSNGARAKRLISQYKSSLIDLLQGTVKSSPKGLQVVFHDGSKALY